MGRHFDSSRLFDSIDDVPREAYTMGIGTIMAAKEILVVANGSDKADIVRRAFFGPVTPEVPASILQFHPTRWPTQNAPHLAARQSGNVQERGDPISRELGSGTLRRADGEHYQRQLPPVRLHR